MLPLRLGPLSLISREPRNCAANRAAHTIAYSLTQIINLPRSLLTLALGVLALPLLLQALGAHKATHGFFGGANVLVPGPGGAVVRVFGDAA
jgi:hypothetical protein